MVEVPWEQGSYFHLLPPREGAESNAVPAYASLFASGRAALAALVRHCGWRRVWLPSYGCPEVVEALGGVPLSFYADTPFDAAPPPPPAAEGEAVVVVNYFGCRAGRDYASFHDLPATVIEDHTHDPWGPWAISSRAAYIFVSLRKTLPVPDGGAVWSPAGASLPASPRSASRAASLMISGMTMKRAYLRGAAVSKEAFLKFFKEAEQKFRNELGQGVSETTRKLVASFPVDHWRGQRRRNHAVLAEASDGFEWLRARDSDGCPYTFVILLPDPDSRERLRKFLIGRFIYPAVLWPLEEQHRDWAGKRAMELSSRMLAIHCDGRYGPEDMRRVAATLKEFRQQAGLNAAARMHF